MKLLLVLALCLWFMPASGMSGYSMRPASYLLSEQVSVPMEMTASWYGPRFHNRMMANGAVFDRFAVSAAHRTLPFGTVLEISYADRIICAPVTDRGPYHPDRHLDLSQMAAYRLGMLHEGVVTVSVRVLE